MGRHTGIAWTRSSFNPWIGCTEVSPGCDSCYARELDKRHRWGGATHWGAGVPRHRTSASTWKAPTHWNQQCQLERETGKVVIQSSGWTMPGFWPVFPSLCDPFDNEAPTAWRQDLWKLIYDTPNLTWLLLTKRIGNAGKMLESAGRLLPNVWLGASIVNQEEADRDLPKLLAVPAAKRFVSYEPALGPVDFRKLLFFQNAAQPEDFPPRSRIDQIIVGGESRQGGKGARPFDIAWARSTVRQCRDSGIAPFVKQFGGAPHDTSWPEWDGKLKDRAGADPAEWPEDLRVQEFPE